MTCKQKKRVCRNSHKLKITLVTTFCGEGDFDKRGVLTYPQLLFAAY